MQEGHLRGRAVVQGGKPTGMSCLGGASSWALGAAVSGLWDPLPGAPVYALPAASFSGAAVKVALWRQGAWEPLVWSLGQSRTVFCERCSGEVALQPSALPGALVLLDSLAHGSALPRSFPAFRSVSYSSTNGPSVAREKRLRHLAGALTCPERCLLKLLFSSFGQGPCAELFPVGVPGCLQSISPHRRLETGKKASLWELTLIPRPHSRTGCVPLWTQINKLESF